MYRMTLCGLTAALIGTAGSSLAAQQRGMMEHGQMMRMEEMMAPMMAAMAFAPEHLLARKDSLRLTDLQIGRLMALRDAAKPAHDAAHTEAQTHLAALAQAFQAAAPDTAAVRRHFEGAHAAMGRAHGAMLTAAARARAVLDDAQRARVAAAPTGREHGRH